MAVDFIIGTLLLLSVLVNVLALYAFRVTPSLKTRSNSFVINLLAINVVTCVVLAVFLTANTHAIRDLLATHYSYETGDEQRFFLDTVATLGSLSLTLVIWDSHSAITDPLRYHSRLSTLKVGLMIAAVWLVGGAFGTGSYFWGLHNLYFKVVFCTTIVLAPFCLICAMYYRIFREARENGLRMRQNGSSPLLQSALNLVTATVAQVPAPVTHQQQRIETILEKTPSYAEGLTLKIDGNDQRRMTSDSGNTTGSLATLNGAGSRKQSLRQMFLFGVNLEDMTEEQRANTVTSTAESLLNKLNNLKLQSPEVRQVRSTPDLHRYLYPGEDVGIRMDPSKMTEMPEKVVLEYHSHSQRSSVPPQTPPKHLGYMTSIRHRLSNASSLFKYREESRAARISILVVIMFLVSYIPYGLLMVADEGLLSHYTATILAIFFVVLATLSSPIIFAYRNKRVQRAVKRLLRLDTSTNEMLPSSVHSSNSNRLHRQNTFSVYRKNLVLKSGGAGRKMQKLLLTCPKEKQLVTVSEVPTPPLANGTPPRGYENSWTEMGVGVDGQAGKDSSLLNSEMTARHGSTSSTTSTIRCEDVVVPGEKSSTGLSSSSPSLLSRFGFIRRQSGAMQKYGVAV